MFIFSDSHSLNYFFQNGTVTWIKLKKTLFQGSLVNLYLINMQEINRPGNTQKSPDQLNIDECKKKSLHPLDALRYSHLPLVSVIVFIGKKCLVC